ncbi:MAG TPA: hypothetical protein VMT04_02645, partial [Terriglobales bacterium]|nr:hypothetical protein [Terriglobales bacterium]
MKKGFLGLFSAAALILIVIGTAFSQKISELKIDPLLLVSLKECRNITENLGNEIYPGWDFKKTPVLLYRPKVQELLINFPHKPKGFSEYTGFSPLTGETIYVRNDTTFLDVDDQNTTIEVDGVPVLVVADPFSRMRNQLRDALTNRSKETATQWLESWNFIQSPYDELQLILHEAFHVYQARMAPEKNANEMIVTQYPLLDPVNNALYVLEGEILRDALISDNPKVRQEKIKEFVAVRTFRQSRLDSSWVEYENLNEFAEGTARYVEYKFMTSGDKLEPIREMYYHQGFNGYQNVLFKQFKDRLDDVVKIVSVSDDRFGNKFGSGPLRFKLYELGACEALLLDEFMPAWKVKIFTEGVYLGDLLKQSVALSSDGLARYLEQAKSEYNYPDAYEDKLKFEKEGKDAIQKKIASILNTDQTLVKISYKGVTEKIGIAFTPFGVTQVDKKSAIYDMVPIKVRFKEGVELQMKQTIPVFIDKENKIIAFAVPAALSDSGKGSENILETP